MRKLHDLSSTVDLTLDNPMASFELAACSPDGRKDEVTEPVDTDSKESRVKAFSRCIFWLRDVHSTYMSPQSSRG